MTIKIAIIGGTGLTQLEGFDVTQVHQNYQTELGVVSSDITEGRWHGVAVIFLARHGHPHKLPPHKINYRANILALQELGATSIIAVNAVGGIHPNMASAHIAVPHQIIDYTYGREHTFFDGEFKELDHIDFTFPYAENIRQQLIQASLRVSNVSGRFGFSDYAVYGATQGPRLETIAEVLRLENDGCDLVGMTGMPEAALARELEIDYAAICLVVNPAAGKSQELITMQDILAVIDKGMGNIKIILSELIACMAPN